MKKLLLLFGILVTSLIGYGQAPVANMRVADSAYVFTSNVPVGYIIYSIAQDALFVCKTATALGKTLGDKAGTGAAYGRFTQLATGAAHNPVTIRASTNGLTLSTQELYLDTAKVVMFADTIGTGSTGKIETKYHATTTFVPKTLTITATSPLTIAGTTSADLSTNRTIAINNAAADGSTKGAASFATADFEATAGNITLDYTNAQKATSGQPGFMTAAQAAMLDTTTVKTGLATNYDLLGKASSTLTSAYIYVGNSSNVATGVQMSQDASITNTGAVTVSKSNAAFHVGTTLTVAGVTDDASPDSVLTLNTGVVRKTAMSAMYTALGVKTAYVDNLEVATADSAALGHYHYTLTNTPISTTVQVSVNGVELKPTTQYTIVATNKIRIALALTLYDKVSVSYSY